MTPLVTVVTVVRNGERVIADCLRSVASQTLPCEHLVVDGRSTDDTLEVVHEHGTADRVISEPDEGMYDAMNKGIRAARGEVIGILNADDFYADRRVLERVAHSLCDTANDGCYGDLVYVRRSGAREGPSRGAGRGSAVLGPTGSGFEVYRYWKAGRFDRRKFYFGWMPPHPTVFVRRRVYQEHGLFDLRLGSAADYELMLRFMVRYGIRVEYLPEVLVCMRTGGVSNASMGNRLRANAMDRLAWTVNELEPHPWTVYMKPLRKLHQWWSRP